ncbi:MAG: DNA-binding protein [Micropruina sp.]|nr:DNA-binding protein [Micropruina sp.]
MDALLATTSTPLPAIGRPAVRGLASIGVVTLEQVIEHSEAELLALHGVGPRAVRLLADELARRGWTW